MTGIEMQEEVIKHFAEHEVYDLCFDLEDLAEEKGLTMNDAYTLCCNLEDEDVMNDLTFGDYSTFDHEDSSQFNDCYLDMMDELGL